MKPSICRTLMLLFWLTATLHAQSPSPALLWEKPSPIPFLTPLTSVQLNAVAVAGQPVPVPLAQSFNITGISSASFAIPPYGGFDHVGRTYPAELIGSSITWRGITFPLGAPNVPDAVMNSNIPLPQGQFGTLLLLGALVDDVNPPSGTITISYTDGTTTHFTQSFSDWVFPLNFTGETVVACYPYRYWIYDPIERDSICVYGYAIPLDPTRTVESFALPDTPYIVMLSAVLEPPVLDGTIAYAPPAGTVLPPGTSTLDASFAFASAPAAVAAAGSVPLTVAPPPAPIVPSLAWPQPQPIPWGTTLSSAQLDATAEAPFSPTLVSLTGYARAKLIDEDGVPFGSSGVDGSGSAYSSTQLGASLPWLGAVFPLGAPGVPDAVSATTIPLPPGSFTTLYLLGTAGQHAETAQPFTITYSDGSADTTSLSLSTWINPQHFPGESIVSTTPYADTQSGGSLSGSFNIYGYQIPLDATKTVSNLQLPPSTDVMILAAALGSPGSYTIPGTIAYTPAAGTLLPEGTNPLSAAFTPLDPTLFASANATNSIVVTQPELLVVANDATRLYGAPNPAFTGSVSGAVLGNTFTESFATSATALSPAGSYTIVPSASGPDLSHYQVTLTDGTLTIAKAPVNAALQLSAATIAQGAPVTLTASITSTTQGTPTGTVQFFANGTTLGTLNLVQGTASLTTSTLDSGPNAITLQYSGDADFLSSSASATLIVQAYDFTFDAPNGTTLNATWGSQSSLVLHLAPQRNVYQSSVSLSVAGIDDDLSSAQFAPRIVASAAGPTDVQFTVSLNRLAQIKSYETSSARSLALAALFALPFVLRRRRRVLLLTLLVATALNGCGSGYRTTTIPLTVTATDGTHTHTLALTLQVSGPK